MDHTRFLPRRTSGSLNGRLNMQRLSRIFNPNRHRTSTLIQKAINQMPQLRQTLRSKLIVTASTWTLQIGGDVRLEKSLAKAACRDISWVILKKLSTKREYLRIPKRGGGDVRLNLQ